jgi:hypothetical protein
MAQKPKNTRWSYKEDRHLLELAGSSKSPEEISSLIGRSPEAVRKVALRLGISLKRETSTKNGRRSAPTERLRAARAFVSAGAGPKGR